VPLTSEETRWDEADLPRIFPWLAPTMTSEGARLVTPENAHPLQCWWGMPRRIRLDFGSAEVPQPCDLTRALDEVQVRSWRQRPRGANYAFWGRVHPLTPHYAQKQGSEFLPLHPQPGGVGYRHWLGLVMQSQDGLRLPAATISTWRGEREREAGAGRARLLAAGYDMDNMKARGFVESEMPLPAAPDEATQQAQDALAERLVLSANLVAGMLRYAARQALFSAGASVKLDAELLNSLRERLWEQTEADFFEAMLTAPSDAATRWLARLQSLALAIFDEVAPLSAESGAAAPRIGKARRYLLFGLRGFGKDGGQLFDILGLPPSQAKAKKPRGKAP
jgi:CRISPR system Cascade subunit CasA